MTDENQSSRMPQQGAVDSVASRSSPEELASQENINELRLMLKLQPIAADVEHARGVRACCFFILWALERPPEERSTLLQENGFLAWCSHASRVIAGWADGQQLSSSAPRIENQPVATEKEIDALEKAIDRLDDTDVTQILRCELEGPSIWERLYLTGKQHK